MTASVEQTQSDLVRFIGLALGGEEIVITQAGQPVAKLTAIVSASVPADRRQWLESLRQLREDTATGRSGRTTDEILAEDRAEPG